MARHVIAGVAPVQLQFEGDLDGAVSRFFASFPNARIEMINGRDLIGYCEGCDAPVSEGDEHFSDGECVLLCERCY